jgi:hypothetical protein
MESMVRRALAISLVGLCLGIAACGSDDDSPESAGTGAGASGATGPTSNIPPIPHVPGGDGKGGSGGGASAEGNGATGRSGSSGSERSGDGGRDSSPNEGDRERGGGSPGTSPRRRGSDPTIRAGEAPPVASDSAAYRVAKDICAHVTLEGIAVNLRISLEKRDNKFVARAFSRSYPSAHRDAAYRGCLEGFRNPVGR